MLKRNVIILATLAALPTLASAQVPVKFLGTAAQASAACHSVTIDQNTKYANVTRGQIVRFVANGKEFTWSFDGIATVFDLNTIAPAGILNREVLVAVQPRPEEMS